MEREHNRETAFKEMHGYRELDREMSGLVPRTTSLGVTDAIVSELFSTARSQFRDFTPPAEPIPKDYNSALNYVRGEPDKTPGRASPAVRAGVNILRKTNKLFQKSHFQMHKLFPK